MVYLGMASLTIKPAAFGGVIVGAVLFGSGMAIFGYCPGTSVAACGEGRRDAMMGVLGMLAGAFAYVAAFPMLQGLVNGYGDWGEITLPTLTGLSPWLFVSALALAALLLRAFAGRQPTIQRLKACSSWLLCSNVSRRRALLSSLNFWATTAMTSPRCSIRRRTSSNTSSSRARRAS